MEITRTVLLDSALDLVTFFSIFKDDMKEEITSLAADLDRCVNKNDDVEIIHTGSGFEQLSLPHIENYTAWNTDADHMIIRTDIEVNEGSEVERMIQKSIEVERMKSIEADLTRGIEGDNILADVTDENVQVKGIASSSTGEDVSVRDINEKADLDIAEEYRSEKSDVTVVYGNKKAGSVPETFNDEDDMAEINANQSNDSENKAVYIYGGSHYGYVFVSNEVLQRPFDSDLIQKRCRKNSEFIDSCRETIPLERNVIMATDEGKITGPSYSLYYQGGTFIIYRDFVYGLKCKFWPIQAQEWIHRERFHGWPSKDLISSSVSQGCHVVPVGSHNSDLKEFEWRFSFSVVELRLAQSMTENQKLAFSILKAIIKNEMKRRKMEVFASYHLKTIFFWFLEGRDWKIWKKQSLGTNILELLDFFIAFYADGVLPNYFISKNNMIDHRPSEEILSACDVLNEMRSDFTMSICRYIEANQALPVFFDVSLTELLKKNPAKFLQVCRYNFLVMALAYILLRIRKAQNPVSKPDEDVVCKLVHKASLESTFQNSSSQERSMSVEVPTTTSVLAKIEKCIEEDQMKVTENSAVILAVFNSFLTLHPTPIDKIGFPFESLEFQKHLTNPAFMECLLWTGRLHEKHCDVIYEFVVKKWVNGPNFHTKDEQAEKLMKLLMVILGKPTKQACAVTGSFLKRKIEGQRFLLLRFLANYLLHVHVECSYVAYQACGYLMDKPVISEIYGLIDGGSSKSIKLRALELVLSKEELQAQLSEEDFDRLVQMHHELGD